MTYLRNLIAVLAIILATQTISTAQYNQGGFGQQQFGQQQFVQGYGQQAGVLAQVGQYQLTQMDVQAFISILEVASGQPFNPQMRQLVTQQVVQQFQMNPAGTAQELQACHQLLALAQSGGFGQQQFGGGIQQQQNFNIDALMYGGQNPFTGQQAVEFGQFQNQLYDQNIQFQQDMHIEQQYLDDMYLQDQIDYDYNNSYDYNSYDYNNDY